MREEEAEIEAAYEFERQRAAALAQSMPGSMQQLPQGRSLELHIWTTWGDEHYIGLMGVEIFDEEGRLCKINEPRTQVVAKPASINVLQSYDRDPRTVDKLVDGTNATCDALHGWLAPYDKGRDHIVRFDLGEKKTLSLLRVWNYNASRAHASRGARVVEVSTVAA